MELFSIARSIRFRRVSPRAISLVKEPGGRKGEGGSGIRRKGTVVPALFSRKGKRCQGQDGWCQHREATRRVLAINSLISLIKIPPTGEGVQGPFDRAPTGIIQLVREACVSCPIGGR